MINRLRHTDWLAVGFYPLAVVLMEAFWVSPWLAWLGGWPVFPAPRPVLGLGPVVFTLAVSLLVTRVVTRQKWPVRLAQAAIIGAGLVAILLVLGLEYRAGYAFLSSRWFSYIGQTLGNAFSRTSTAVPAVPVLLYLWWRGINLGQTTAYFKNIYRSFLLGMVALIVLIILWQASGSSGKFVGPGPGTGWYVIAFFFFGLLAIAICHLYLMRGAMPREEAALTSVWRWLPIMLGVIGGMVAVGFGVASLFSTELFNSIGRGAGLFFNFLGRIFEYLAVPLNYLFEAVYFILRLIVSWLRSNQPLQPGGTANMSLPEMPEVALKTLPPEVILIIKWVVIALVAAAVVFILAKAVSRFREQRAREEIEEIHESLWSWRGFRDDLKLLLQAMGRRFQRQGQPSRRMGYP